MQMDRIKRDRELRERIAKDAYIENKQNKPVVDGPIDPQRFYTTNKSRVVFFLQEPYRDNGGWDMSESLRRKNSLQEQPRNGKPTIGAMVKTALKLNDCDELPNSKSAFDNFKETVGYVNVKKEPNTTSSRSDHAVLKKHADKNRSILKDQYDNMGLFEKDTVILAGTKQELVKENGEYVEIFCRKFFKDNDISIIKKGRQEYIKYNNKDGGPTIIAAPHPAAARFGRGNFSDNINKIRNCKNKSYKQNTNTASNGRSTSLWSNIIDAGANACRSSMKYIKDNPGRTTAIACGIVVVLTGGFLLYRKFKKRK